MSKHIIYGLVDPNTNELRYIGYTSNMTQRYNNHHSNSQLLTNSHKNNWIKSLIKIGRKAKLIIIKEYNTAKELPVAEEYWYDFFTAYGANLTNEPSEIGGRISELNLRKLSAANTGKVRTDQHKQRVSQTHKGKKLTGEHKQKISKALKGRKQSPEAITNATKGRAGYKHSDETKKKLSTSHLGINTGENHYLYGKHHSEETRSRMSKNKGRTWKVIDGKRIWLDKQPIE